MCKFKSQDCVGPDQHLLCIVIVRASVGISPGVGSQSKQRVFWDNEKIQTCVEVSNYYYFEKYSYVV